VRVKRILFRGGKRKKMKMSEIESKIEDNERKINELFSIIKKICPHPPENRRKTKNQKKYYCYVCEEWIETGI
jgi:hypothetical protein